MSRWAEDRLHIRAKREGYRSRAAYKLIEIQQKFHMLRRDDNVVDLGAAPGSWLQVIRQYTEGTVVGIDLNEIEPLEGVVTIRGDFSDQAVMEQVRRISDRITLVVCDASPKITGHRSLDQARAVGIGMDAVKFARSVLFPGGKIIIKSFQGDMFPELLEVVRRDFETVHLFRPRATRKGSAEIYIVGKKFRGQMQQCSGIHTVEGSQI